MIYIVFDFELTDETIWGIMELPYAFGNCRGVGKKARPQQKYDLFLLSRLIEKDFLKTTKDWTMRNRYKMPCL